MSDNNTDIPRNLFIILILSNRIQEPGVRIQLGILTEKLVGEYRREQSCLQY